MAPPASSKTPEELLNSLVNAAYSRAKHAACSIWVLQVLLFLGGVVAVFVARFSLTYPYIAVPLAMVGAALGAYAGKCKSDAEALKRRLEIWAGFGKPLSGRILADFRQKLPQDLPAEVDHLLREGNTYASAEKPGPRRAAQNLSESAWFSQDLAGWCADALAIVFTVTLMAALSLLLYLAIEVPDTTARIYASKCVSATLLFIMSAGVWRSWQGYRSFSARAKEIDNQADALAAMEAPDSCEVQRLLAEYQLARAAAPLIPTWVWRLRRHRLDDSHKTLRTRAP